MNLRCWLFCGLPLVVACADVEDPNGHDDQDPHEQEVITTVELHFDGPAGLQVFRWADPENDGDPVIDTVGLVAGDVYDVSVVFLNELEEPAEDLTEEIADEADEHQVFFTGAALDGLLLHTYADADANGDPLGLDNTLETLTSGTADLVITLLHLPPENGQAVKTSDLADVVASDGFAAVGGSNDAQVTFSVQVP